MKTVSEAIEAARETLEAIRSFDVNTDLDIFDCSNLVAILDAHDAAKASEAAEAAGSFYAVSIDDCGDPPTRYHAWRYVLSREHPDRADYPAWITSRLGFEPRIIAGPRCSIFEPKRNRVAHRLNPGDWFLSPMDGGWSARIEDRGFRAKFRLIATGEIGPG